MRFFRSVANHPMESIESVVAFVLSISGLWFISPFYEPSASTSARITQSNNIPVIMGALQICLAGPLIYALCRQNWPIGIKVRRTVSFICFLLLMFYGFSGLLLNGLHRISWLSSFGFAVIAAVAHLRLKLDLHEESEKAADTHA